VSLAGIIPTLLGNIIGGAGFCGAFYYYLHLYDEPDMCVDGIYYERLEEDTLLPRSQRAPVVAESVGEKPRVSTEDMARNGNTSSSTE
jgi:hypothetical protein